MTDHQRGGALPSVPAGVAASHPVFAFLLGEGPLDGFHFGDSDTSRPRPRFWWRAHLREALAAITVSPTAQHTAAQITPHAVDAVAAPMTPSAGAPVAWMVADEGWNQCFTTKEQADVYGKKLIPLYAAPQAAPDSVAPADPDIAALRTKEPPQMRRLRWLLANAYAGSRLYRDDGEYSDPASGIDFRRDSVEDIERKMQRYGERLIAAVRADKEQGADK